MPINGFGGAGNTNGTDYLAIVKKRLAPAEQRYVTLQRILTNTFAALFQACLPILSGNTKSSRLGEGIQSINSKDEIRFMAGMPPHPGTRCRSRG